MPKRLNPLLLLIAIALWTGTVCSPALAREPQCRLDTYGLHLGGDLSALRVRLAAKDVLKIVAIGSSSTAGAGASAPERSYPAQLARHLAQRWPQRAVQVSNRGVNGEEAADMIRRFERDLLMAAPDLVIWQVGTNYLMRNQGVGGYAQTLHDGLDRLRQAGINVILMDPQYAPRVLADPDHQAIVDLIADIARERGVALFPRFKLMQGWGANGVSWLQMLTPDLLHLNDWSYGCIAEALALELTK
ncbi:MAG: multifunctional acyl-CoA thioesterase and protease and lysophospholipase [Alphaproteobacteria bacterium]|jgi:lysophospholipase L1-like esterase|nr:multifunctional acyl-CoA thioesterase and protease and lysophospholipase [Alphaproteobacteria bacterium]